MLPEDYDDVLYALYTYLPDEMKERLAGDLQKHLVFFSSDDPIPSNFDVTKILNSLVDEYGN